MSLRPKHIILIVLAVITVGYTIGVAVWTNSQTKKDVCPALVITITDFGRRQYVTEEELVKLLKRDSLYPVGVVAAKVSIQRIEEVIQAHPMVRKAECYMNQSGIVCVRLTQREPILRVVTGDASYFVDRDQTVMPIRESVRTPVLLATGNIGERLACNELAQFALWLEKEPYWQAKIQRVQVVNPKMVYLVQKPDGTHLILGEMNGFRGKMNKLRKLYDKGFEQIGWQTYREIDLRFKGQVVGRN
jgi:cell division protein FtsQ